MAEIMRAKNGWVVAASFCEYFLQNGACNKFQLALY